MRILVLSKRERVIRTLELEEPDIIPIFYYGIEKTGTAYQAFMESEEYKKNEKYIKNSYSRFKNNWVGDITVQRFFNVDLFSMDPFRSKVKYSIVQSPPGAPGCVLETAGGRLFKIKPQVGTGKPYLWYMDGYYKTPEIRKKYWDEYGKPSELIDDKINYSPKVWNEYVESLSPYLYPMANLGVNLHEALFEGMTMSRVMYYMRKDPKHIHEVMTEYTKTGLEIIKRLSEAGVEVAFYGDDLGSKGKSIFSLKSFREFILPYYRQLYQACRKRGIFIIQHSCGYIDNLLPDMVDAGLQGIQALEPAAGVDLANLKETLGDRLCFLGGMDSTKILNFGSPKDIEEDVKKCIKAAGVGGGYFAGPSHDILNVPWENLLVFHAALEKYRKYPLNF